MWNINGSENTHTGKFVKLDLLDVTYPNGNTWKYEAVSRMWSNHTVWALIENTTHNTLLLIEQYRPIPDKNIIELVAGICWDATDLTNEQNMRKEIHEESGYVKQNIKLVLENIHKSPGLTAEMEDLYHATVTWARWPQQLQWNEDITVHEFPKQDLNQFLASKIKEGCGISSWVYAIIGALHSRWIDILS